MGCAVWGRGWTVLCGQSLRSCPQGLAGQQAARCPLTGMLNKTPGLTGPSGEPLPD